MIHAIQRSGWMGLAALMVGAAALVSGCGSGTGSSSPNPFIVETGGRQVESIRVFGDSYSVPTYNGRPTWPSILAANAPANRVENYAVGGATAAQAGGSPFNTQLDRWLTFGAPLGPRDLSVVYFGYNDIGRYGNGDGFAAAAIGYQQGVNRLLASGAANPDRALFLTQIHDWSANPGVNPALRGQVQAWNAFVAGQANRAQNVVAVDLFTVFDRVYANPGAFGLTNVTTVDAGRSSTTSLYVDDLHFGVAGQNIITRVYLHYLTRAWDWATRTSAGPESAALIAADVDAGLLSLRQQDARDGLGGLRVLSLAGTGQSLEQRIHQRLSSLSEGGRSLAAGGGGLRDGWMLDYRPVHEGGGLSDSRFGVSLARYDGELGLTGPADWNASRYTTDAVSLHWQHDYGTALGTTRVSMLNHQFETEASDRLLGLAANTAGSGRSLVLSQRLSSSLELDRLTLTPWVALSHHQDSLAGGREESLYTSGVTFGAISADQTLAEIGIGLSLLPVDLGFGRSLNVTGSVYHQSSLQSDAIEVSMREDASPDILQVERVEREPVDRYGLSMSASIDWTRQLDFGMELGALMDAKGTALGSRAAMTATYLF